MVSTNTQAAPAPKPRLNVQGILGKLSQWLVRNRVYFAAFAIPAALTYLAYIFFGIYPFGEESVLCLDLNGQYVYYFEAIRDAFWGDGSIFYSWSRNLSGEYMGVIGYYLASPFTLIVVLLPEKFMLSSLLIMQLCKLGAAGVTFSYFIQKSKGVQPLPSLLFSTMYAMMAYGVIQLIDPMWLDGLVFLPLIMLGIEYLVDDGRRLNFIIPLALMCVANFYIGFMICIFVAIYFLYYFFLGTEKRGRKAYDYVQTLVRMAYSSIIALAMAAFMLLPVYNALKLGKFDFTDPDYHFRFQNFPLTTEILGNSEDKPLFALLLDLVDMLPQLLPAQYDSVNVQGKPEIYCGLLMVVLLPMFYMNKGISRRKKVGYSLMILVMLTCMMIVPIDMMWHGGQVPNWLPFRYAFLLSFIFLSMAALTFANREHIKGKHILGSAGAMVVLIGIVAGMKFEQMAEGAVWISAALMAVYLLLLYFLCCSNATRNKRTASLVLTGCMLLAVGAEATYNAVDSMHDIDDEVAYSTRKSYQNYVWTGREAVDLLEEYDDSFYRAEKTFFRTVNDNGALGLNGISHSSSVMNARILTFLETLGYSTKSYYSRYDGNTALADSLLGIKYVLDKGNLGDAYRLNDSYLPLDWQYDYTDENGADKTIQVYENPNALSIGYMVDEDLTRITHLGNDNPFNSQNLFMSTMSGNTTFDDQNQFESWHEYYKPFGLAEDAVCSDSINVNHMTAASGEALVQYRDNGTGDPTVDFHIEVTEEMADKPLYYFFKTVTQKKVTMYLYDWTPEEWAQAETTWREEGNTGDFTWSVADGTAYGKFASAGNYFEDDDYTIRCIGSYPAGTKVTLRMTVSNADKYTEISNALFYYFDQDLFQQDIDILKQSQWQIDADASNDRKLTGTITAAEGQLMLTSIPYEPGWSIKIDGKKIDNLIEEIENEDGSLSLKNQEGDTGQIVVVDSLIGIRLPAGEHTVTMTYTPPGWWIGIIALVVGAGLCVLIWFGDRKRYAVMLVELQRQKEAAEKAKTKRAKLRSDKAKRKETQSLSDPTELLENLDRLHDQGILTDAEYQAKKAEIEKKAAKSDEGDA